MKRILVLACLALSALAQRAIIISPVEGSTLTAGSTIVVDVHQQNSLTDEVQVAIVLGLAVCSSGSCDGRAPDQDGVGTILYQGEFKPQRDPSLPQVGPHQNFTVQVPDFTGPCMLSLAHLELVGVSKIPILDTSGIVVNLE